MKELVETDLRGLPVTSLWPEHLPVGRMQSDESQRRRGYRTASHLRCHKDPQSAYLRKGEARGPEETLTNYKKKKNLMKSSDGGNQVKAEW